MKVYRIEHQYYKNGPYVGIGSTDIVSPANGYFDSRCPGPIEDGISREELTYNHYFGFAKMKQMFTWFRARDVFKLRKHGYRVYRYKVADEHVCRGYNQLAFVRSRSTVREEVKMSLMVRHLCSF